MSATDQLYAGAAARRPQGATGNLATEDLAYRLRGLGIETGVDLDRRVDASLRVEAALGAPLSSRALRARLSERRRAARSSGRGA